MVVSIYVKHIFKHPIDLVVRTHFTKYPSEREKFVLRIDVLEHKIDFSKGLDYRKRLAVCQNVIPHFMRKISFLNEENLLFEEQTWMSLTTGCLHIKSRNITWAQYANMKEESYFSPCADNPKWTNYEQHGIIDIQGFGFLGAVLEKFAKQFMSAGAKRGLKIMEEELNDRRKTAWTTVS